MPLNCVSEDTQLSKTSDVETNIQIKLPFVLNGSPMTTRPQSLRNLSTYRIKNSSLTKPFDRLNGSDYVLDNLLSENIIGGNSNTTLRYESQTYTQKFIALHSGIWGESGTVVSIFFTASNEDMFHIYIPVTLTGTASSEENKFIKAWTDPSYTLPSPFNANRLLEFIGGSDNIRFRISNFCLKFNNSKKINHYSLCKFNNPHTLKYITGSSWLGASGLTTTAAPSGDSPASYRRTTFNAILNFMLNGTIVNQDNRNFISTVEHIATSATPLSAIKPIFYSLTKDQLFTTSKVSATGVKGLQNIKCYPLDLASQVDENGNIFIDQETRKPIQVKNIGSADISAGESAISAEQLALNQKENNDYIKYVIIFAIIFGILIVIVIALVYYIYRQRISSAGLIASYQTAAFLAASSSVAAPAAAAAAAPVAPPPAPGGGGAPAPGGGGAPAAAAAPAP